MCFLSFYSLLLFFLCLTPKMTWRVHFAVRVAKRIFKRLFGLCILTLHMVNGASWQWERVCGRCGLVALALGGVGPCPWASAFLCLMILIIEVWTSAEISTDLHKHVCKMKYVQLQVTMAETSQFHLWRFSSAWNPPGRAPARGWRNRWGRSDSQSESTYTCCHKNLQE